MHDRTAINDERNEKELVRPEVKSLTRPSATELNWNEQGSDVELIRPQDDRHARSMGREMILIYERPDRGLVAKAIRKMRTPTAIMP